MPDYAIFILRFILFATAHSLFATARIKRITGKEPRSYRLVYNLASLAMFMWVMAAYRHSPVLYYAPGIWSLLMYLIQVAIAAMLFVCLRQTGAVDFLGFNRLRSVEPPHYPLITSGWYAVVRHPLYLLSSIFLILNPVMTGQWLLLTILSIVYFVAGGLIEEQRLLEEFGEEYRSYQQKVPFMIPAPGRFGKPPA